MEGVGERGGGICKGDPCVGCVFNCERFVERFSRNSFTQENEYQKTKIVKQLCWFCFLSVGR